MKNIQKKLDDNIQYIQYLFNQTSDLVVRNLMFGNEKSEHAAILYIDGIIDTQIIQDVVIKPILGFEDTVEVKNNLINLVSEVIESVNVKTNTKFQDIVDAIVNGKTAILIEGHDIGIIVDTPMWNERSIE